MYTKNIYFEQIKSVKKANENLHKKFISGYGSFKMSIYRLRSLFATILEQNSFHRRVVFMVILAKYPAYYLLIFGKFFHFSCENNSNIKK